MTNYVNDSSTIHTAFRHEFSGPSAFKLDVDVTLPGDGITAVFGASGSGKTTYLRCIAGLERPKSANIVIKGEVWQNETQFLAAHQRSQAYVFQESSLFAHLNAQDNLRFAIKRSRKAFDEALYRRVIEVMGISSLLQQLPAQLSGGEQQRVAIARALLVQPQILLMDEPLASLDLARKHEILPYLEELHNSFAIPVIYVTHSIEEVARLADYVLLMKAGQIVTQGPVEYVMSRVDFPLAPGDDTGVVLKGKIVEKDPRWHLIKIELNQASLWLRDSIDSPNALANSENSTTNDKPTKGEKNKLVRVRILAKDVSITLSAHEDTSIVNRFSVEISKIVDDDDIAMALVQVRAGSDYIIARLSKKSVHQLHLEPGKQVWAQIKTAAIVS